MIKLINKPEELFLTHYYRKGDLPFQSLSYLPENEALDTIEKFRDDPAIVYRRFRNPKTYLLERKIVEAWLRNEFCLKGGQPKIQYPYYMVLGESCYIDEGYNGFAKSLKIPLSYFSESIISFTYSDSMVSKWLETQSHKNYYNQNLHNRVFTLTQIMLIIDEYGIPDDEWKLGEKNSYNFFLEAQIWDSSILNDYLEG